MKRIVVIILFLFVSSCVSPYAPYEPTLQQIEATRTAVEDVNWRLKSASSLKEFSDLEPYRGPVNVYPDLNSTYIDPADLATRRRIWYVGSTPSITDSRRSAVLAGKCILGMTSNDLWASIGTPKDVNRTVISAGIHEQWVYYDYEYGSYSNYRYYYFDNGILTAWQD